MSSTTGTLLVGISKNLKCFYVKMSSEERRELIEMEEEVDNYYRYYPCLRTCCSVSDGSCKMTSSVLILSPITFAVDTVANIGLFVVNNVKLCLR